MLRAEEPIMLRTRVDQIFTGIHRKMSNKGALLQPLWLFISLGLHIIQACRRQDTAGTDIDLPDDTFPYASVIRQRRFTVNTKNEWASLRLPTHSKT